MQFELVHLKKKKKFGTFFNALMLGTLFVAKTLKGELCVLTFWRDFLYYPTIIACPHLFQYAYELKLF